jgi:hypothetical protein
MTRYEHASIIPFDKAAISNLPEGANAYTVPWAVVADEEGHLYIRGDYTWSQLRGGTVSYPIRRQDGRIVIDYPPVDYPPRVDPTTMRTLEPAYLLRDEP